MWLIEALRFGREFGATAGPRPELGRGVTAPLWERGVRVTLPLLARGARLTCALRLAGVPWLRFICGAAWLRGVRAMLPPWLRFICGAAWLRLTWDELRLTAEP